MFSTQTSRNSTGPLNAPLVVTLDGNIVEVVNSYKYVGILIDDSLTFKSLVMCLVKKLRLKLGFYFCNKMCFSLNVKNCLVAATFLPVLDYGDLLYMHASAQCLQKVDAAYHASLRFITTCKPLTHHCELYSRVGWSALATLRMCHWYTFIYKAILGLLPRYLWIFIVQKVGQYFLRSQDLFLLNVPFAHTDHGKRAFKHSAPSSWNTLQNVLKLDNLITLTAFKSKMKEI